jgi:DNA polymerase bacteriophage-type
MIFPFDQDTPRRWYDDALHLDYETRSKVNLRVVGPWVYGEHWSTDVWCACFARGEGEVEAWHPGDSVPDTVTRAYADGVPFIAHNVGFERAITLTQMAPKHGWPIVPVEQWYCTASMGAAMALPRGLEDAAVLMGCIEQKDMEGHALMMKMSKPEKTYKCLACAGTGTSIITRNTVCTVCGGHGEVLKWRETPEMIERGTTYCKQDVRTERSLACKVRELPPAEREVWLLDQRMNERGVLIDAPLVRKAQVIVAKATQELTDQVKFLTQSDLFKGGVKTSQVAKLRWWLAFEGLPVENLSKDTITGLLESQNLDAQVAQALELRQEAAKSSNAKLNAYLNRLCADAHMRDNLMYHGASTGRWTARGAQLQNLPSRYLLTKDQVAAALWMLENDWDGDQMRPFTDTPLEVISACLRGMIIADPGEDIIAVDYNSIEARGTAWLSLCVGLLGVFERGEDPYLYMASRIYSYIDLTHVDWANKREVNELKLRYAHERMIGKIAVLGLGYQMGWEKFQATCAKDRVLISDQESKGVVGTYREANFEIPELWGDLDQAAMEAVTRPGQVFKVAGGKIRFMRENKWLYMGLPSGRVLSYANPSIKKREMPWIDESTGRKAQRWGVSYFGVNSITHRWGPQHGYGGKWCENAVQGLCRDLLAQAMLRLEARGYRQIISVHDEAVSAVPEGWGSVSEAEAIMCEPVGWAEGLPVKAEGWRGKRYGK